MFHTLAEKFHGIFSKFKQESTFTEDNIKSAVADVRLALLDADVNYKVAGTLIKRIKEKVIDQVADKKIKKADAFIHIVHEELIALMGLKEEELKFNKKPTKILLCGLQGSGKTTTCAKLAFYLKREQKKSVCMVALDLQRPAAVKQLEILGKEGEIEVFSSEGEKDPLKVLKSLKTIDKDVIIYDTAGRQNLDDALMEELLALKEEIKPDYVLFVANCASGQTALTTAHAFDEKIGLSGSILTMLDGSAKAGAAISIKEVTNKPLFFEGVGEKISDLQVFNPKSMADRILGMGDVINLVKNMKREISEEDSKEMEQKILKATFTYQDFLKQMKMLKKMGSFKKIFSMMPGFGKQLPDFSEGEEQLKIFEAIIYSMTPKERGGIDDLTMGRKRRIAKGASISLGEVNKLVKKFQQMKEIAKHFPKFDQSFSSKNAKKEGFIKKNPNFDRFFS
jgi:signal recognition particle subunit SRP54